MRVRWGAGDEVGTLADIEALRAVPADSEEVPSGLGAILNL